MSTSHQITIDGRSFWARKGELLLDAALNSGLELPYDCREGHCGTCCIQVVSGRVTGGEGAEPGTVHACQCRITGDAVLERRRIMDVREVDGVVTSLHPLSADVMEVGVATEHPLLYLPGQYAQVRFRGFPSRPFSMTHAVRRNAGPGAVWFHVRRMKGGHVTPSLGKRIARGHRVKISGPYGSAHFKANVECRLVLVATNTGFAPIWSIAVAALRENPERIMMVIAGGRGNGSLYMWPALQQLSRFPNVVVVPVCSSLQAANGPVFAGRPTDYLPQLLPGDVVYACGAPAMVDSVKAITVRAGAICHADPFNPTSNAPSENSAAPKEAGWLSWPSMRRRVAGSAAVARSDVRKAGRGRMEWQHQG